ERPAARVDDAALERRRAAEQHGLPVLDAVSEQACDAARRAAFGADDEPGVTRCERVDAERSLAIGDRDGARPERTVELVAELLDGTHAHLERRAADRRAVVAPEHTSREVGAVVEHDLDGAQPAR